MLTINKASTYATQVRTKADPYQLCRCRAAPAVGLVRDPAAAAAAVALVRGPAATAAAITHVRGPATAAVAADAVAWRSHQCSRRHSQRHSHGRPGSTRLRPPIDCCVCAPPRSGNTRAPAPHAFRPQCRCGCPRTRSAVRAPAVSALALSPVAATGRHCRGGRARQV